MDSGVKRKTGALTTVYPILFAVSIVHLLNDTMQSAISALFPVLKDSLRLTFTQIGFIAFALNVTASLLQPLVGVFMDARPKPYILPVGVIFTLIGIVSLALAPDYSWILAAVVMVGLGSAVFHPESSRVAYLASGGRRGLAQSIFQVGGNIGTSLGPIMTALIFVPLGQFGVIWFAIAAGIAIFIQLYVARWYSGYRPLPGRQAMERPQVVYRSGMSQKNAGLTLAVLIMLVFSKTIYTSSITSFYSFYLIGDYGLSIRQAQLYLFAFLSASAVGAFVGGPLADRYGRRNIIWFSILGTAPFSLLLPYVNLFWSVVLCICAGIILSSSFSVIVVYAQELWPNRLGLVSGLFFGLAFGLGGLGSALLGMIADATSISFIMKMCAFLPLMGLLTILLPKDEALTVQPPEHFSSKIGM